MRPVTSVFQINLHILNAGVDAKGVIAGGILWSTTGPITRFLLSRSLAPIFMWGAFTTIGGVSIWGVMRHEYHPDIRIEAL